MMRPLHFMNSKPSISQYKYGKHALMASLFCTASIMGCSVELPTPAHIFSPAPGTVFLQDTGEVVLSSVSKTVCYTTDGSMPDYNGGSCIGGAGGTTLRYSGSIELVCNEGETGTVDKQVRIVYDVDKGDIRWVNADYSLTCSVDENTTLFSISGVGTIDGLSPGTTSTTGSASLNRETGVLDFNFTTRSKTGFTDMSTSDTGSISGVWANPTMGSPTGTIQTVSCSNFGGLVNGCDYVTLDEVSNMGVTDDNGNDGATCNAQISDSLFFDLNADNETILLTCVWITSPALAITANTYTLTALAADIPDPVLSTSVSEKLSVSAGSVWQIKDDKTVGADWETLTEESLVITCDFNAACDTVLETVTVDAVTYKMKTYTTTAPCPYNPAFCDISVNDQADPAYIHWATSEVSIRVDSSTGFLLSQEPTESNTVTCRDTATGAIQSTFKLLGHHMELIMTGNDIMSAGVAFDGYASAELGTLAALGLSAPLAIDCDKDGFELFLDGEHEHYYP